ncbi:MAG: hypothetical protein KDJ75_05880 [Alphaproteobacteria bacterium]|nr:hypothetical protein [Alphaproteobacteria bacterium]
MSVKSSLSSYYTQASIGRLATAVGLSLFLNACSTPPTKNVAQGVTPNCLDIEEITYTQSDKVTETMKFEGEDGKEIKQVTQKDVQNVIEKQILNKGFNHTCRRFSVLAQTAQQQQGNQIGTIAGMALLHFVSSDDPATRALVTQALKRVHLNEFLLEERIADYFQREAQLAVTRSVQNITDGEGWNLKEMAFLWESWNGDKSGKGQAFEHVPVEFLRETIQQALSQRTPPMTIGQLYETLKQETPKGEVFRCVSEQTEESVNDQGQKTVTFTLCGQKRSDVFPELQSRIP